MQAILDSICESSKYFIHKESFIKKGLHFYSEIEKMELVKFEKDTFAILSSTDF